MSAEASSTSKNRKWPKGWEVAFRRQWEERGGTLDSAVAFAEAGWSHDLVLKATSEWPNVSKAAPPPGGAQLVQLVADDPACLLDVDPPLLSADALLLCGRLHLSGDREIWEITESSHRMIARRWYRSVRNSGWEPSERHLASLSLVDALSEVPELHLISGDVVTRILVHTEDATEDEILRILKIVGQEVVADDWPGRVSENWSELDDYLGDIDGCLLHNVWARIGSLPVIGISLEDGSNSEPIPALVDIDSTPPFRVRVIANYSWFSESGGAPISWDGGAEISQLSGSVGFEGQFGDEGNDWHVIVLPEQEAEMADLLADWIVENEAEVAAAMSFETLDPNQTLSNADREQWSELIEGFVHSARVSVHVSSAVFDLLRESLTDSDRYSRASAALRNPGGPFGLRLHKVLTEFSDDGVLGPVELGDWSDPRPGDET